MSHGRPGRHGEVRGRRTLSGYSLGGLFGTYVLFHRPGLFQRYLIGSPSYLYADGAALRWPGTIGADGARPSGVVATSVGTAEPAEDIAAWRDFWDEVERRRPPALHLLRTRSTRRTRRAPGSPW